MTPALEVRDAFRIYESDGGATVALQGLTLTVAPGEVLAVLGPSGSGKTTFLRAVAGLESLSAGSVRVLGTDVGRLDGGAAAAFRAAHLGFLDQHYARALSPDLSCRETVGLQLRLLGGDPRESRLVADGLLDRVGLADRAGDRPEALSGGEQQRVAVCAAVAHRPRLLLADEPVGELDAENAATVYRLIGELTRELGGTALIVTHDEAVAAIADRMVYIRDGRLVGQSTDGQRPALVVQRGWVRLPPELVGRPDLVHAERRGDHVVLRPLGDRRAEYPVGTDRARTQSAPTAGRALAAELHEVTKSYPARDGDRLVLSDLSHPFEAGVFHAVVGRSGSGKTTLLHLLAGLERPTAGDVLLGGAALNGQGRSELAALRREGVALVAQEPGLVPYLSARENVLLGVAIRGGSGELADRANEALRSVGLADRLDQRASSLSAGERQRVAIARALAADVPLLLVDEPTARLDEENGRLVGRLLDRAVRERGIAVVCATHDPVLIELAGDVLGLDGGGSG